MDSIEAVRVLALHSVVKRDIDYVYRHIFRWYSQTFHTPLHSVYDLPIEEVLQHFFESKYEDVAERQDAIDDLKKTPEQKVRERRDQDVEDYSNYLFMRSESEKAKRRDEARALEAAKPKPIPPELPTGDTLAPVPAPPPRIDTPVQTPITDTQAAVPVTVALGDDGLPDISMSFDGNLLDDDLERFNTMAQPESPHAG